MFQQEYSRTKGIEMNDMHSRATVAEKEMVQESNRALRPLILTVLFACALISATYFWNERWVYVTCLTLSVVILPICMHCFSKQILKGYRSWERMRTVQDQAQRRDEGIPPLTPI